MHRTAVSDAAAVKVSLVVIDAVVCEGSMHSCALRGPPLVMHAARQRAKRLLAKSRIGPSDPSPRVVGVVVTAPEQENAGCQNQESRLALD